MAEKQLSEIDLNALVQGRAFTPSPEHWEDEALYFLLADRFSDGKEDGYLNLAGAKVAGTTPKFTPADNGDAISTSTDAQNWRNAGANWVGGTIEGLRSKLGYLKRLGISATWVSPLLKQVRTTNSYHGYAIQNFLDVDRNFGTRAQLQQLVAEAHQAGIRVILDIILNHSGDVFGYNPDRYPRDDHSPKDPRWDGNPYQVAGFRDPGGNATLPFGPINLGANPGAWPEAAIWPAEFQNAATFTCKGRISNWDYDPEFLDGDFDNLKDMHHGLRAMSGGKEDPGGYQPSSTLNALCEVYKFWLAYLDLDGYRVDTIKHMDLGATRYFCSVIHEFAESIGKSNFYLIGEITGGRDRAFTTQQVTGLDAALGIDDVQDKLEYVTKGSRNAADYFGLFRNSAEIEADSHRWFRDKVVTQLDDHDQVRKGNNKARFCAGGGGNDRLVLAAIALNALTLGIPCIYYGTEQQFDGAGSGDGADRYIREAMFGGAFGAFRSKDRHFFDESHWVYQETAKILKVRRDQPALRRGRQYLREISGDGVNFGVPVLIGGIMRSVVPWSRIFNNQEVLAAINTDPDNSLTVWVTIDNSLHQAGDNLICLYSTDSHAIGANIKIEARNGKAVSLTVPAAGVVVYA